MNRSIKYEFSKTKQQITMFIFSLFFATNIVFAQEQLQFEKKEIQFGIGYDSTKSTLYIKLNFEIPIVQNNTALQKIRTQILSQIFDNQTDNIVTDSATLVHIFFGEIETLENEIPVRYEKTLTCEAFEKTNGLSYVIASYIYSGGAHGYTSIQYFEFDLQTGKRLTEEDIFTTNYEKILSKILLNKLKKDEKVKRMDLDGFYEDRVRPNGNFSLEEKGVRYFFNSYEIAPYAFGNFSVFIPFEEIQSILK